MSGDAKPAPAKEGGFPWGAVAGGLLVLFLFPVLLVMGADMSYSSRNALNWAKSYYGEMAIGLLCLAFGFALFKYLTKDDHH